MSIRFLSSIFDDLAWISPKGKKIRYFQKIDIFKRMVIILCYSFDKLIDDNVKLKSNNCGNSSKKIQLN
jgi:hypothetical protein